jgi:hypothetical protein
MIKLQEIVGLPTLQYHLDNELTLSECVYRYSSDSFVQLFNEARQAWRDGKIVLPIEDVQLLESTDIGEYGLFEGVKVPLDLPLLNEQELDEAEYHGKKVELGKPKRGGSKKFVVYVKDPKSKKIKKVQFGGTTGLSIKIDDPKARHSFAARHKCATEKNRLSPNYWGCHIGRYWKSLGGAKNFSGYW